MSLCLKNRNIEAWEDVGTNRDQDYLTHSIFRYFGKLPPILTCKILTEFVIKKRYQNPLVLDLMCGSGTTLVEAQKLGIKSIGIDSNDISLLISKVKTTKLNLDKLNWLINEYDSEFCSFFSKYDINYKIKLADKYPNANLFIPKVSNIDKWFTKNNQIDLAICRSWIEQWKDDKDIYDFLLLCWLGIIRQCSNASVRTGRIFLIKIKYPLMYI